MATTESGTVSTAQPNLHTQDLSTLNVATLTPLSPEVISRQATINIGTIGHVAHGKSTVVKAISGVQTVRFKNELERNITIKLERLQFGPDGKVIQPKSELNLERERPATPRTRPHVHARLNGMAAYARCRLRRRPASVAVATKKRIKSGRRRLTRRQLQLGSRTVHVPAEVPKPTLQKPKPKAGAKDAQKPSGTYKREYVVERILAHVVRNNQQMFLVKWQGWSEDYNSWEPLEHLTHCERVLEDFLADSLQQPVLDELQRWLQLDGPTLAELNETLPARGGMRALPTRAQVQRELMAIAATPVGKRPGALRERCRHTLLMYWVLVQREKQLTSLHQWQCEMNEIAGEPALLTVENDVDLEGAPAGFVYVNGYVAGEGVIIPDDPPIGCECAQCNGRSAGCCSAQSVFAYRRRGRINVPQGTPIYECNRRCRCDPIACSNRVVQRGRTVPLCIFRTTDGRGWGVRTLRRIYAGEFVCEYVGEVISFEEAERRGRGYDAEGRTYLFDLDFNSHDFPYTVDAATYGNVSHFINHSCEPNLGVWAVWVNCLDPNLPRLALFATRDIAKDEEVTFDYMCNEVRDAADAAGAPSPSVARTRLTIAPDGDDRPQCKCGARSCRRYLF